MRERGFPPTLPQVLNCEEFLEKEEFEMRNKWCKYVIFLAMILSVASTNGSFQSVFAQEVVQSKETSDSDLED